MSWCLTLVEMSWCWGWACLASRSWLQARYAESAAGHWLHTAVQCPGVYRPWPLIGPQVRSGPLIGWSDYANCTLGQHVTLGQMFNYVDLSETFIFSYAGLMPATRPHGYFPRWWRLCSVSSIWFFSLWYTHIWRLKELKIFQYWKYLIT